MTLPDNPLKLYISIVIAMNHDVTYFYGLKTQQARTMTIEFPVYQV